MRCGAFGDMVLLTPLIQTLATRFATPVDIVSSGGWTRPLLEGQPGVGELYLVKSRRRPYLISPDQWELVRALRARRAGPTWFLDPAGIGRSLLERAGIDANWTVDGDDWPRLPGEHYLERFQRIAAQTPLALGGVPVAPLPVMGTTLRVRDTDRAELLAFLSSLVLFPPDDTASTLDPGDRLAAGFPQVKHGAIKLTVLFNDPTDIE